MQSAYVRSRWVKRFKGAADSRAPSLQSMSASGPAVPLQMGLPPSGSRGPTSHASARWWRASPRVQWDSLPSAHVCEHVPRLHWGLALRHGRQSARCSTALQGDLLHGGWGWGGPSSPGLYLLSRSLSEGFGICPRHFHCFFISTDSAGNLRGPLRCRQSVRSVVSGPHGIHYKFSFFNF